MGQNERRYIECTRVNLQEGSPEAWPVRGVSNCKRRRVQTGRALSQPAAEALQSCWQLIPLSRLPTRAADARGVHRAHRHNLIAQLAGQLLFAHAVRQSRTVRTELHVDQVSKMLV
jgi:hypothetical protein